MPIINTCELCTVTPREHQARASQVLDENNRYGLFWDMGTGKTIATLLALAREKAAGYKRRTVVLCPKNVIYQAWLADGEYFPTLDIVSVHGVSRDNRMAIVEDHPADVFVTTYETFRSDWAWYTNPEVGVSRLVIDESSKIKNHKAKTSTTVHAFADRMTSVWALSGTPAPNNETEYWSQFRAIYPALVGRSFYRWANIYFTPITQYIQRQAKEVTVGWQPRKDRWPQFVDNMRNYSWALESSDVLDLPDQVDIVVPIHGTAKQQRAYQALEEELVLEVGETGRIDVNASAKLMKCRQVANGWAYTEGAQVVRYGAAKLEAAENLLLELRSQGEQVVVWGEFRRDLDDLADLCKNRWRYAVVDGRASKGHEDLAKFQNGELDVIICHPASVGHGVTLTAAAYVIFYSVSYSSEQHGQARKRTHRMGQDRKVFYYYLTATGTVEPVVLKALQAKVSVSKAVLQYLKRD